MAILKEIHFIGIVVTISLPCSFLVDDLELCTATYLHNMSTHS
jgi:hypothetical protein